MSPAERSRSSSRRRRSIGESSAAQGEDWLSEPDPKKRRQLQNMLAQRRFRERQKERKEEQEREAENKKKASSAYSTPEAGELEGRKELSGLPWGGLSMKHIVETGKFKEQNQAQSSRETSVTAVDSRTRGSSGLLGTQAGFAAYGPIRQGIPGMALLPPPQPRALSFPPSVRRGFVW